MPILGLTSTNVTIKGSITRIYTHDTKTSYSTKPTFGVALNVVFPRNRRALSLYNELVYRSYYIQDSTDLRYDFSHSKGFIDLDFAYLNLCNMVRYQFPSKNNVHFFVNGGLFYSFKLRGTTKPLGLIFGTTIKKDQFLQKSSTLKQD